MKKNIVLLVTPLLLLSSCAMSNTAKGRQTFEIPYGEKYINPEMTGMFGGTYLREVFTFNKEGKVTITLKDVYNETEERSLEYSYVHANGSMIIGELIRCEINEKFMIYYPRYENKQFGGRLYYVCFNENHPSTLD